jgi:hypothetical protein
MKTLRKIVAIVIVLVVITVILAGCMGNKASSSTTPSTVTNSTEVSTSTSTDSSATSTDSGVIKEGTIPKDGNVILKELAFVYNGNTLAISDIVDDEKLESILGKVVENKAHTYSKDDGLNMDPLNGFTEKQYKFSGIDIKTINATEDKNYFIFNIKITDSKYSTIRNIKVGDSVEKLKEAYPEGSLTGNGAPEEEDDFLFLPVNYVDGMKFHIKDKKIESISMYTLLD